VVASGQALAAAQALARDLAKFPQACLRSDRRSAYEQWGFDQPGAMQNEFALGVATIRSGETVAGAARFASGAGRHGTFNAT
jgi:enoyl-CoA hydratase